MFINFFRSHHVKSFKKTEAYSLAKAIDDANLRKIERLVKNKPELLLVRSPEWDSNLIALAITSGKYKSLKKLLELGGNPNYINSISKMSPLLTACFWNDVKTIKLLLDYKADPNYAISETFATVKGNTINSQSPLNLVSRRSLKLVKLLLDYGANPFLLPNRSPLRHAISSNKFDIIYFYIEEIGLDIHAPLLTLVRAREKETGKETSFFIQDSFAKMHNTPEKIDFFNYLEQRGVDFENYDFVNTTSFYLFEKFIEYKDEAHRIKVKNAS